LKTVIVFHNQKIPVFYNTINKKAFDQLLKTLERKWVHGKQSIKKCLETLISIEIDGTEAILHARQEKDTLALSLY
jgi:hypothetical protein